MAVPEPTIRVVSAYGDAAASTRVRAYEWLDHLGLVAHRSDFAGLPSNSPRSLLRHAPTAVRAQARLWALSREAFTGTVFLTREASPFSHGRVESRILGNADHGVYDLDDALFADTSGWRRILGKDRKAAAATASAGVVIAGNEVLAQWASQYSSDVRMIPSCIEPAAYRVKDSHEISDTPTLVWMGSRSTEAYLADVAPALREIHRRTGARMRVISAPNLTEIRGLEGIMDRVAWTPSGFANALAGSDVALAPLVDTAYARGKCAYKLLQYAATGLPVVGSPVGANSAALRRFDGWAAETHDEWVDALAESLSVSAAERARRGSQARRAVADHYSFAAWAADWKRAVLP